MRFRVINEGDSSPSTNKPTIHNVHILDASGSMSGSKYRTALESLNRELQQLKGSNEANYTQTLVEFQSPGTFSSSNTFHRHYFMQPINDCTTISGIGADGGTPLYEAVGVIIEEILSKMKKTDRVLITIFTDGGENTSKGQYKNASTLKNLITKVEEKHNFTVTFIGTDQDVSHMVNTMHINAGNTLTHDNTMESINTAYMTRSANVGHYAKSMAAGASVTTSFFAPEQEEQQDPPILPKKSK